MQKYSIIGADNREYGPVTMDQLHLWIREGRANAQTRVRLEGSSFWTTLGALPEFSAAQPAPASFPITTPAPVRRTNSMAMTGLVMGILAMTIGLCCCGLPFNVLGLIFSAVGLNQIKDNPDLYEGRGLAIGGLGLSILSLLLIFARILFFGALNHFQHTERIYRF